MRILECLAVLSAIAVSNSAMANETTTASDLVSDWNAAGNGCRGGKNAPKGSAQLQILVPDPKLPNAFVLRFTTSEMKLQTPPTKEPPARPVASLSTSKIEMTLATECSLRVSLAPGTGKRVRNVTANASATVSKAPQFASWVSADLALGKQILSEVRIDYKLGEEVRNRNEEFRLIPGRQDGQNVPESRCGQPRLLALNTIFASERKSLSDSSQIELANKGVIDIALDLEDCK